MQIFASNGEEEGEEGVGSEEGEGEGDKHKEDEEGPELDSSGDEIIIPVKRRRP